VSSARRTDNAAGPAVVPGAGRRQALATVSRYLRCPVCAGPVRLDDAQLACEHGHRFDIARQGYVNLIAARAGRTDPGTGDSTAMVAARELFLGRGHYRPIADAVTALAARDLDEPDSPDPGDRDTRLVADLAGGTGYYLARVLDALPGRAGVCLDLSVPALRRAARAHPRAAAVGADAWQPLPLSNGAVDCVLSVFGPRNAVETARVLAPGGTLVIAAPGRDHHEELRGPLGLIGIDERKEARIADAYGDYAETGQAAVRYQLALGHDDAEALVAMGPSARHITPEALTARIRELPAPLTVTVDVQVRALQRPRLPGRTTPDRTTLGRTTLGRTATGQLFPRARDPPRRYHDRPRESGEPWGPRIPGALPEEPGQSRLDGRGALRYQLTQRTEFHPAIRDRGMLAAPRAAVAAGPVECAGQGADRAQQLRQGLLVQLRYGRVNLGQQSQELPEAAPQFSTRLLAVHLAKPALGPRDGVHEGYRNPDHGASRVLAAGPPLQGRAHVAAIRVQPFRPQIRPKVIIIPEALLVIVRPFLVTEFAITPEPVIIGPVGEPEFLAHIPLGHVNPPIRSVEFTFQP
jgi:23S rRNA (guanine745-N1)-methyltransferase